ncbi:MAG: hypothetical protein IJV83_00540 [Clostridia bacterium]|nr:hypothetical protein [Clostridia bacterium]
MKGQTACLAQERKNEIRYRAVWLNSAKECAYLAVFVALVIVGQVLLAVIPGVEIVTLLFIVYAFVFGLVRGMFAATAFALLRQLIFGFFPTVLILYLTYYNVLACIFGALGRVVKKPLHALWWLTAVACLCTVGFTMLDNVITPWFYAFSHKAWRVYFYASLSFMIPQVVCTAVTVSVLFYPLQRVFKQIKKGLR